MDVNSRHFAQFCCWKVFKISNPLGVLLRFMENLHFCGQVRKIHDKFCPTLKKCALKSTKKLFLDLYVFPMITTWFIYCYHESRIYDIYPWFPPSLIDKKELICFCYTFVITRKILFILVQNMVLVCGMILKFMTSSPCREM